MVRKAIIDVRRPAHRQDGTMAVTNNYGGSMYLILPNEKKIQKYTSVPEAKNYDDGVVTLFSQ
jgi:hypothetical protein